MDDPDPVPTDPSGFGFGMLFESFSDAVVVADSTSGKVVLWNAAAETLFGYSRREGVGLLIEELMPERMREWHREGLARYSKTGHGSIIDARRTVDLPALRKDGTEIEIELTLSKMEVPNRQGRYVVAVIRDLTQQALTEEELRSDGA